MSTAHGVEPSQYEPGVPLADQPRVHHVDLELNTLGTRMSYALTRRVALELEASVRSVKTDAAFEDVNGVLREDLRSIHHRDETIDGFGDVVVSSRWRLSRFSDHGLPTDDASRTPLVEGADSSTDVPSAETPTEIPTENPAPGARRWLADLVVGISIPTGGTEEDPFTRGEQGLEHQHVFFGSGTWDPSLRLELYRSGVRANLYSWLGGSGALGANSKGYRAGFSGSAGAGVSTTFGLTKMSFQAQLEVQHAEPSTWGSDDARNSGRTDLIAGLGAAYELRDGLVLRAQIQIPENIEAQGGVLEPRAVALVGLSYSKFR